METRQYQNLNETWRSSTKLEEKAPAREGWFSRLKKRIYFVEKPGVQVFLNPFSVVKEEDVYYREEDFPEAYKETTFRRSHHLYTDTLADRLYFTWNIIIGCHINDDLGDDLHSRNIYAGILDLTIFPLISRWCLQGAEPMDGGKSGITGGIYMFFGGARFILGFILESLRMVVGTLLTLALSPIVTLIHGAITLAINLHGKRKSLFEKINKLKVFFSISPEKQNDLTNLDLSKQNIEITMEEVFDMMQPKQRNNSKYYMVIGKHPTNPSALLLSSGKKFGLSITIPLCEENFSALEAIADLNLFKSKKSKYFRKAMNQFQVHKLAVKGIKQKNSTLGNIEDLMKSIMSYHINIHPVVEQKRFSVSFTKGKTNELAQIPRRLSFFEAKDFDNAILEMKHNIQPLNEEATQYSTFTL